MPRILAFDIGIKNLAWCCGDVSGSSTCVQGWSNENLITGSTADEDVAKQTCSVCKKGSTNINAAGSLFCVRHCPLPAFRTADGDLVKKAPSVAAMKIAATAFNATKADMKSKASLVAFLETRVCFPKPKAIAVKKVELEHIHDGLRAVILANRELFSSCDAILLENQPAFKNPVMKSVQMMLFASLRDLLIGPAKSVPPPVRLVHAGRKTVGATKGDEGYTERKNASETRVLQESGKGTLTFSCRDIAWFRAQSKKSDLADCLCMVMDSGAPSHSVASAQPMAPAAAQPMASAQPMATAVNART